MYMSKAILRWPACRNPYQWHRLIWELFDKPNEKRDFQFVCLDRKPGHNINAIVLSLEKPVQREQCDIAVVGESKSIESITFKSDQMLAFRIVANPTKIVTETNDEKRKVRVPLIKEQQQSVWLQRHLVECAEILTCTTQNEPPLFFNRNGKAGKIVPVLFEGQLKVVDPNKFIEQIYKKYERKGDGTNGRYIAGIGPAKAFGCGLLLIKPIHP